MAIYEAEKELNQEVKGFSKAERELNEEGKGINETEKELNEGKGVQQG